MTNSERIQANNQDLQVCIDKANALPNAGSGGQDLLEQRIEGTLTEYSNPNITTVAEQALRGLKKLAQLNLPNATLLGSESIRNCTSLTSLVFPNVTSISTSAMNGCTNLQYVEFGARVSIGQMSFSGCTKLDTVVLRANSQCTLQSATNVFTNTPIADGTGYIYVPAALVDSYKSATNWSTYASQIRAIEDYPDITGA